MYWIGKSDGAYVLVDTPKSLRGEPLLVFEDEDEAHRYLQILNGDPPSSRPKTEPDRTEPDGSTTGSKPKIYRSSTHVIMLTQDYNTVAVRRCSVRSHLRLGHTFSAKKVDVHCPRRGVVVRVARATAKNLIVNHRFEWGGRAELIRVSLSDIDINL